MKLSYSALWDDAVALLKANGPLIVPIAGAFLFLPALLLGYALPLPEAQDFRARVEAMEEYAVANFHWLFLQGLATMLGSIAILLLVFAPRGTSVAGAIKSGAVLLPTYFAAFFLSAVLISLGLWLLVLPGLYLFARMAPLGPVVAAERRLNPIAAIRRSFEVTKGKGWALLGFLLLLFVPAYLLLGIVSGLLRVLALFLAGEELGEILSLIVSSALGAGLSALFLMVYAAIYRRLAAAEPQPKGI